MKSGTYIVIWLIVLVAWIIAGVLTMISGEVTILDYLCAWAVAIIFCVYMIFNQGGGKKNGE